MSSLLPCRGVHDATVVLHGDFGDTRVLIDVKHLLPGQSPVPGPEQATLLVGAPSMTRCGDENDIGILGVDGNAVNEAGVP